MPPAHNRAVKADPDAPAAATTPAAGAGANALSTSRTAPVRSSGRVIKKQQRSPSPPPPTAYRDIPLLSTSAQSQWVHHLIRFAHHTRIDPTDESQFVPPLKLNRKQPPKTKLPQPKVGDPVVDKYGRPIKLHTGETLTWPKAGDDLTEHKRQVDKMKPQEKAPSAQYDASLVAPSAASANRAANRPLFQKRVRQIHKSSTTSRRLHNDETVPWVLEDFETPNYWESSRTGRKDNLFALAKHLEEGGIGLNEDGQVTSVKEESSSLGSSSQTELKPLDRKTIQHAPWIGKLEGDDMALGSADVTSASSAQVLFVFDERNQGGFRVVPVRKTYRFMQKSRFADHMSDEDREKAFAKQQKSREIAPEKFANRYGTSGGVSAVRGSSGGGPVLGGLSGGLGLPGMGGSRSSGGVKKEEGWDDDSWPELRGLSLSAASSRPRNLIAVSGGSGGGGRRRMGDDEGDFHRRGADDGGTFDEVDYQEDFADDEERMGGEAELVEDADAREMEERLKREMAKAGIGGDDDGGGGGVDDDDDAPQGNVWGEGSRRNKEDDQLTGSGRQMKKIMKALSRREGGAEEYDSDEEVNPYASDESDGEEVAMANPEEAMRRALEEKEREEKEAAKSGATATPTPGAAGGAAGGKQSSSAGTPGAGGKSALNSERNSRGTTPNPTSASAASRKDVSPHHRNKQQQQAQARKSNGNSATGSGHHRAGSGHADLAKRATTNAAGAAAGGGGSSGQGSRSGSPAGSRSPSPGRGGGGVHAPRQSSPLADGSGGGGAGSMPVSSSSSGNLKRPASPEGNRNSHGGASGGGGGTDKRLKTNAGESSNRSSRASSPTAPPSALEQELINLVRTNAVKNVSEVIAKFKKRLQENKHFKQEMTAAFKRVLTGGTKGESLRVKEGF